MCQNCQSESHLPGKPHQQVLGTVMLLEDDAPLHQTLRTWLENQGWRVVDGTGLHDSVSEWQLHRDSINLVISDYYLAENITGQQLADYFQMDRECVPCLMISGAWAPGQAPSDEPERKRYYRAKLDLFPNFINLVSEIIGQQGRLCQELETKPAGKRGTQTHTPSGAQTGAQAEA
ncbi:MAG: hypothetical protein WCS99_03565 [Limisphaerales bacterium]